VDRLLAAREGALEGFDRALAADPASRWPTSAGRGACWSPGRGPGGAAAAAAALALAGGLERRERRHVEAPAAAATAPGDRALALIREQLAESPRDVVAPAAANGIYGLTAAERSAERNEDMLALLDVAGARLRGQTGVPGRARLPRAPRPSAGRRARR
jgi:hypothetical protein